MKLILENMIYMCGSEKNSTNDISIEYSDSGNEYPDIDLFITVIEPKDELINNKRIFIEGINNIIAIRNYLDNAILHFEKSLENKHECYDL